ncbi:aryl-alcohol dehydrogenase-like predicted oxidoreductase [Polaromonas sp. CG_9.7]|nr:aryl-alcohol dehydrogenase-like predicted oxidoreductase [Polaromonas sp. CG_9.7]
MGRGAGPTRATCAIAGPAHDSPHQHPTDSLNRRSAAGHWLRRLAGKPLPGWAPDIGCTSWAQVLLKFVLSHPAVTCAIPGTGRSRHRQDNLAAGRGGVPDAAFWRQHADSP